MILWQFIVLMASIAVCRCAAEVRDSKRNEPLKQLIHQLGEIENRLGLFGGYLRMNVRTLENR